MTLDIANLTTQKIGRSFLQKAAAKTLEQLGQKNATVSLVLLGEGRIRQLNKTWRGRNQMTDLLAFAESDSAFAESDSAFASQEQKEFITPKKFDNFLGEIFICLPQAKKQAKKLGHSLKNELTLLLVHGILHLVGYEDEGTEKEKEKMEMMQNKIFKAII